MKRLRGLTSVLLGFGVVTTIVACQTSENLICPGDLVETPNFGSGEVAICCPASFTGLDGVCIDPSAQYEPEAPVQEVKEASEAVAKDVKEQKEAIKQVAAQKTEKVTQSVTETVKTVKDEASQAAEEVKEVVPPEAPQEPVSDLVAPAAAATAAVVASEQKPEVVQPTADEGQEKSVTVNPDDFIYLTAPNGKGSAYCPRNANSLAWNGVKYKCCGKGLRSVIVPSREDSICCPQGTVTAKWVGKDVFDYECCPKGTVEVKNEGAGDKYICCLPGQIARDGICLVKGEVRKDGKILMTALGNKGQAYCPENANSLAWDSKEFQCCGQGMKATLVPSRGDSICCPNSTDTARWVGRAWNDFECCPAGTVETQNFGAGEKYVCCPAGYKSFNGECLSVR